MTIREGYIGITSNFSIRRNAHINNAINNRHPNQHLMKALKKYTDIIFVELHSGLSLEDALSCEAFYRPCANIGWNIKAGGLDGAIMSEVSKQLISKKHKGKVVNDATKSKLRNHNLGKKQSEATIAKRAVTLSTIFKGRPKTSEKEITAFVEGRKGLRNVAAKSANIYTIEGVLLAESVCIADWCRNTQYSAKQLQKTANPNESITIHKGIYAIYTGETT